MFKFGVFTVMLPDLTPEIAAQAIAEAGYDGVEWRVTQIAAERRSEPPSFWGNNLCTLAPTLDDAQRGRRLAEQAGLVIPNLGTYIDVGDLAAVDAAMHFAKTAGAPSVRVGVARSGGSASFREMHENSRRFLREVDELSQITGVRALVEIHHGTIAASASLAHSLVQECSPERIGVIHDAGNMAFEGFENYRLGLEQLGPYLAHVHVKNAAFERPAQGGVWRPAWAPLNDGVVDFNDLFACLRHVGYTGWVVVEDFSQDADSRTALVENLRFLRSL